MKKILSVLLALYSLAGFAQENVRVHNGTESYVTTIEYLTFDVSSIDTVISIIDQLNTNSFLKVKNDSLVLYMDFLSKENKQLADSNLILDVRVNALFADSLALKTQLDSLSNENKQLAAANIILEGSVSALLADSLAMKKQLDSLSNENKQVAEANLILKGRVSNLVSDSLVLKTQLDSLLIVKSNLEAVKKTLTNQLSSLTEERDRLAIDKNDLNSSNSSLLVINDSLANRLTILENQIASLNSKIDSLKASKLILESDTANLNTKIVQLEIENASLELQVSSSLFYRYLSGKGLTEDFAYFCNNSDVVDNDDDYVDLGLPSGTLWATCNVGALNPQDYGKYYAWGETEPKKKYGFNDYFDIVGIGEYNKYHRNGGDTILDYIDDVAFTVFGGEWRMPTKAQFDELINFCEWKWVSFYNDIEVNGYIVYKKKTSGTYNTQNDPHIFLPAGGYYDLDTQYDKYVYGCYWSCELGTTSDQGAFELYLGESNHIGVEEYARNCGMTVRPVMSVSE